MFNFLVFIVVGVIGFFIYFSDEKSSAPQKVSQPVFNEPMLQLPKTGWGVSNFSYGNAPLAIKTGYGANYFIKIVRVSDNYVIAEYFIRGGESIDLNLPSGAYEIRYASGDNWYGRTYLFGPNTSYNKADEIFYFSHGSGYTIELIRQVNGNLGTKYINSSQF